MSLDFFQITEKTVPLLNHTETQLFEFVVKNMDRVKDMSIQKFAADRFLSTTTIFRFTQKLGFSGYSAFIHSLLVTVHQNKNTDIPKVMRSKAYSEEYVKNITEAARVMPKNKIEQVLNVLKRKPNIHIVADDNAYNIGRYCEKLFLGLGHKTYFPEAAYQIQFMIDFMTDDDLVIALSYTGQDTALIETVERIFLHRKPFLLSVTRADNNILQNMSDVNFYIFADELHLNGIDLTTTVPMLVVLELLAYESIVG